jgi:hypothetical protein
MSYGPQNAQKRPPPPGWQPPFSGAPPPVPPGVNPQMWGAGAWQFNAAYQWPAAGPVPPSHAGWAPGYGWHGGGGGGGGVGVGVGGMQPGQPGMQQGPGSFNPYKRAPRQPSAEYMATELVENPLGLSNMIPRYVNIDFCREISVCVSVYLRLCICLRICVCVSVSVHRFIGSPVYLIICLTSHTGTSCAGKTVRRRRLGYGIHPG